MRRQAQVPVIRERLNVIDVHARAVPPRSAAENAGGVFGQVIVTQPLPFRRLVKPLHQARRCALAADKETGQPGVRLEQQGDQFTEGG